MKFPKIVITSEILNIISEIDEFKGLSIIRSIQEEKLYTYVLIAFQNSQSTNYQINETIVNCKRFFSYIAHYVQIYNEIIEFLENKEKHEKDCGKQEL